MESKEWDTSQINRPSHQQKDIYHEVDSKAWNLGSNWSLINGMVFAEGNAEAEKRCKIGEKKNLQMVWQSWSHSMSTKVANQGGWNNNSGDICWKIHHAERFLYNFSVSQCENKNNDFPNNHE